MSALLRIEFPDAVDIGYAASAPLHIYGQSADPNAYFDKVTVEADRAVPGCANGVKQALLDLKDYMLDQKHTSIKSLAEDIKVCRHSVPDYITDPETLVQEINLIVASHFADANMFYYPPGPKTILSRVCNIFVNDKLTSLEKIGNFLNFKILSYKPDSKKTCFDLTSELPPGRNGTISSSDWSGVGGDASGYFWDFQCCTLLPQCSFSENSMFLPRPWTWSWITEHCESRFGVTPVPRGLENKYHFSDQELLEKGVTRLLSTNGLNDGWSVASITDSLSDNIRVINFPNGAHHSDLLWVGPSSHDTHDVTQGLADIKALIGKWLNDIRNENSR
jgi:hypothetical protein